MIKFHQLSLHKKFFRVVEWILIGFSCGVFLLIFSPLILCGIIWRYVERLYYLEKRGFYWAQGKNGYWIYEEKLDSKTVSLRVKLANTEPGHWELFFPNAAAWKATVPDWASERRIEIGERIASIIKKSDFHYPEDWE